MPIYISLFEPKKKAQVNGAVPLVIALEAPNKRAAESIATGKLYEAYPEGGDNFFNPKTVEDQTGHPRPAVGQFDEKFAAENVFDGNAWTPKEPEPELPAGPIDLMAQPANVRIAAVVMYGDAEIDNSQLSLVVDLLNDEETPDDTGMRAVIDGLVSVPAVGAMYPASVYKLVSALFQNTTAMPTEEATTAFAQAWVDKPDDRENLTQNSTSTSTSTSTDNASGAADYNTLSMHTALSIMGVNPVEAKAADVKNAKEIIANRDNAWRAWDKTLRVIVGILNVETDVRHGIISDGLKNLKLISDDAERLHFVKSRLAGHPACAELANYGKGDEKPVEVANLGGGRFSIEGLIGSGEQQVTDTAAAQAKQQLDQMGYGVYANAPAEKSPQLQQAEENADRAEALAQQLKADDFQQRAAQVAQVIAEQPAEAQQNLDIWKRVMRTDPRYTKPIEGAGYVGTSINSEYMFMRATEIFGPIGTGWGFDIVEEKMIAGAPMSEAVFEGGKIIGNRILRDADGSILFEQNHSLLIEFWYVLNGTKGRVTAYGATPYMYKTKRGFMADGEVMKKSLTDAIKKSLSMLGFSADVFLGWHDLPEYREENATEFAIKNASDKAEDVTRLREELDEKLAKVADTITSAVTVNEASKVHASIAREVETHRKAAEAKGDADHAKYLAGRLRRLTALKDERIAALTEEKAS
ncbi:TPA: hypothetical protein ACXJRF_000635 [Serratia marcescens]